MSSSNNQEEWKNKMKREPLVRLASQGLPTYCRWGRLDVTPMHVAQAVRLITATISIYPPGTTRSTRTLLAIHNTTNSWLGASLAAILGFVATRIWGVWPGTVLVIAGLATLWLVTARLTTKIRHETRQIRARFTPSSDVGVDHFALIAARLDALDERSDLDPVSYELEWGHIYESAQPSRLLQERRGEDSNEL